jgi:hypothetical protein
MNVSHQHINTFFVFVCFDEMKVKVFWFLAFYYNITDFQFVVICFQEIARNELSSLTEQHNNLENEIRELEAKSAHLAELYTEQEELLSRVRKIFNIN